MTSSQVGRRVVLGIAAVALILLSVVPTRGIVRSSPDGTESPRREVSCGSVFVRTEWSRADKCEAQIMGRVAYIGMVVFAGFLVVLFSTLWLAFTSSKPRTTVASNNR